MLENLLVVILVALGLAAADARNFAKAERKAKTLYALLLMSSAYLSALFIFQLPWFNIGHLTKAMYSLPAKGILALLS